MTARRTWTYLEWTTTGITRFGADPMDWAFECPSCGDIATGADLRDALAAHPRARRDGGLLAANEILGQECIGRTLRRGTRGCPWAAYGLIRLGEMIVFADGTTQDVFPFAPAHSARREVVSARS